MPLVHVIAMTGKVPWITVKMNEVVQVPFSILYYFNNDIISMQNTSNEVDYELHTVMS